MYRLTLNLLCAQANINLATIILPNTLSAGIADKSYHTGLKWILSLIELESAVMDLIMLFVFLIVSLQSRDRIGTGGQVVDCSRLFDNDLPDG